LPDRLFGPVLAALLVDRTPEGPGPVDFRSLGVREFGTIYEGLLENELAVAENDLTTETKDKEERYRPAKTDEDVIVTKEQIREAAEQANGIETSKVIVQVVKRLGLEPFRAPEPLPPVEESEVRLVCWMSI